MNERKIDRRVQRTRQLLRDALLSLIVEKGYEAITVQNIIDRANLGRSTFYLHYQDKDDLLASGMDEWVHGLIDGLDEHEGEGMFEGDVREGRLQIRPLFERLRGDYDLYKQILGHQGVTVIRRQVEHHMGEHIEEWLTRYELNDKLPVKVAAIYISGGLMTLVQWWLDERMPHAPEQMEEMVWCLVHQVVHCSADSQ